MKMTKGLKRLSLVLLFVMALSILMSCQAAQTTATTKPQATTPGKNNAGGLEIPFAKGEKLKVMVALSADYNSQDSKPGLLPIMDQYEKDTGVDLVFDCPASDYWTILQTRLAAGTDMPDMIMMQANTDFYNAVAAGQILKLSDYFDKMPNIKRWLGDNPDAKKQWSFMDGSIYGISISIGTLYSNSTNALGVGYRDDWRKKLGLAEPKTIADWEKMLTAFRDGDPNGNKQKDEIPFSCQGAGSWNAFSNSYGLHLYLNNAWFVKDKKVYYDYYSADQVPKMKAYLELISRWYKEKLIGNDMLTTDGNIQRTQILNNLAGSITSWAQRVYGYNELMKKDVPGVEWVFPIQPVGPYGDNYVMKYYPWDSNRFVITSKTKYPEIAAKFIDYLLSPQGSMLTNCGIEGVHYNLVNNVPVFTAKTTEEMKNFNTLGVYIASLGGAERLPFVKVDAVVDSALYAPGTGLTKDIVKHIGTIVDKANYLYITRPTLPKHASTMSKMTDITTYITEVVTGIVVGKKPLSEYDAMVTKLKSMGMEEIIAVHQELFDLYNK